MTEPADLEIDEPTGRGFSFVWLVPILAVLLALGIAWDAYRDRGPLIEIAFAEASGIEPGETELRYRDVKVGEVEEVRFAPDLSVVLVDVRVDKDIAPYLDDDAVFWVVQPQITARGISGLNTVLSGVYIQGDWDDEPEVQQTSFEGLDSPPPLTRGEAGLAITLRTTNANGLAKGAPVLHKGIRVGTIEEPRLTRDGTGVLIDAFIEAPYDRLVTTATRFWDTSGFSVSLDTGGLSLDVNSIASLVEGGISFDTPISGGEPVEDGAVFRIYADEVAARESIFQERSGLELPLSVVFDEAVTGLSPGAEVRFRGVVVGEVTDFSTIIVEDDLGEPRVRLITNMVLRTGRLGLPADATREQAMEFLEDFVARGLRARLATSSILTGALVIELVVLEDLPPGAIVYPETGFPQIPSAPAELADFSATAEGVFERINALPVEELLASAISLMDSLDRLASNAATQQVPEEALGLIADARAIVGSEELQALPAELSATLAEARVILAQIEEAQTVASLTAAIDAVAAAATSVDETMVDVDAAVAAFTEVTVEVGELPLPELVASATEALDTFGELFGSEEAQALPPALTAAVQDLERILEQVGEGGTVERLNTALAATAEAAATVDAAVAAAPPGLPEAIDNVSALAGNLAETPLDDLVTGAAAALDAFATVASAEGADQLPAQLVSALADLETVLTQAAEGGTVSELTNALVEVQAAAVAVSEAAEGVPAVTEQLAALGEKANALDLEALVTATTETLDAVDRLIDSDAARALPADLSAALVELRDVLAAVQEGGAIDNLNSALASAGDAAEAVEQAADSLPALSERLNRLVAEAEAVLGAYGGRSQFNSETRATLRDVREAADAITSLARTLERDPSSLLRGR